MTSKESREKALESWHKEECVYWYWDGMIERTCDCGLHAALASVDAPATGEQWEMKRAFYVVAMELMQRTRPSGLDDETAAAVDWGVRLGIEDDAVMFGEPAAPADAPAPVEKPHE